MHEEALEEVTRELEHTTDKARELEHTTDKARELEHTTDKARELEQRLTRLAEMAERTREKESTMSTLNSPNVSALLKRLYHAADETDAVVLPQLKAERERLAGAPPDRRLGELASKAYMPVNPEVGRFLYQLVRSKRPGLVVEFGLSHGISAIHIGAALVDNGIGRLVSTELYADKAGRARQHLQEAGLLERIEIRVGDALETLKVGCGAPIDMLLLDGWKQLYLTLLREIEPFLAPDCLVIADDTCLMPKELESYLAYVRDPSHGYLSVAIPLDDGLEVSLRA